MKTELLKFPISVKTLYVDNRRMTKQFLKQVPVEPAAFYLENREDLYLLPYISCANLHENKYVFDGEILGWVNLKIDKDELIEKSIGLYYNRNADYLIVLFLDSDNRKLKRTFFPEQLYFQLFNDEFPQIYI